MLGNGNLVICSTEIVVVTWSLCICGDNSGLQYSQQKAAALEVKQQ